MTATTPEEQVRDALKARLPKWRVTAAPEVPANVTRTPVAAVWRTDLDPEGAGLSHRLQVNVYGSKTAGEAAELELAGRLDSVLLALQATAGVVFEHAERKSFGDGALAGWEVQIKVKSTNVYQEQIRAERSL